MLLFVLSQLRVRDLEGGLEVEKSANAEANRAVERLSKQIRSVSEISSVSVPAHTSGLCHIDQASVIKLCKVSVCT